MTDEPDSFIHAYLRRIEGMLRELKDDSGEIKLRLASLELALASSRREKASDAESIAHLMARLDRQQEDIR